MNEQIISNLSSTFLKVWPFSDNAINGLMGPNRSIMQQIETFKSFNIFQEQVDLIPDITQSVSSRASVTIWERLIGEFIEYYNQIVIKPSTTEEQKINAISQNLRIPRIFSKILYDAYEAKTISVSTQGMVINHDVQVQGYITNVEDSLISRITERQSNESIESVIDQMSEQLGLTKGVVESLVYGITAKMPPITKSTGQSYMRTFLANAEWHRTYKKEYKVDMWGRQIILGRNTIIKVEISGMFQYIRINPPTKSAKNFIDILKNIEEQLDLQFTGESEYYQPLSWEQAMKFAVVLLDYQEDLLSVLVDLKESLSGFKSHLLGSD